MKRRVFVRMSSLASLGLMFPFTYCTSEEREIADILAVPDTLSHIFEKGLIRDFGKKYVNRFSEIKGKDELLDEMLKIGGHAGIDKKAITTRLMSEIKRDFETNQVFCVDGWFFSETELRQCALNYLMNI